MVDGLTGTRPVQDIFGLGHKWVPGRAGQNKLA